MNSRAKGDKLDRLFNDVTSALETLQHSLPELVREAKARGGEEVRQRILEAASEGIDAPASRTRRQPSRSGASRGDRGFIVPVIMRVLAETGIQGLTEEELLERVQREADREVKRNSYKMALARRIDAGRVIENDGKLFLAEHAEKATTAGREDGKEPTESARAAHDNLWSLGSNDAAA